MMEISQFWIPQLMYWCSGLVFVCVFEKRERFSLRLIGMILGAVAHMFICRWLIWDRFHEIPYIVQLISNLILGLFSYSGWEITPSTVVYNTICSLTLWRLSSELWLMINHAVITAGATSEVQIVIVAFLYIAVIYTICAGTLGKWMPIDRRDRIGPRQLLSALLIYIIIDVLAVFQTSIRVEAFHSEWLILYMLQLLATMTLYIQNELFKKSAMRHELEVMNFLWKKEKEQYDLTRENINLINHKCHDLKHQIRALRKVKEEEFDDYLNEMEDAVRIYESIIKTGNDVFDTVLTEKSLYCKDRQIQVSCVADGSQMNFIDTIDLYAILGNAMDNAIEAVEKFQEPEKRQIDVMIYRQQNFLVMNFINPIAHELEYEQEGGLPITTKEDKRYHGYGLRSMRHFVKKYDGYLDVSEEDGFFSLKIMMPLP